MKIREVVVLEEAGADLEAGRIFYDSRELGIGAYFSDSLLADIESLQLFAGTHVMHGGYFRLLSKRFPFAIYYDIHGDLVRVIAVLDMRRNPSNLEKTLKLRP